MVVSQNRGDPNIEPNTSTTILEPPTRDPYFWETPVFDSSRVRCVPWSLLFLHHPPKLQASSPKWKNSDSKQKVVVLLSLACRQALQSKSAGSCLETHEVEFDVCVFFS